jgi:hypothetical protein
VLFQLNRIDGGIWRGALVGSSSVLAIRFLLLPEVVALSTVSPECLPMLFGKIKQIKVETGGLDGIMYDESDDKIILTNHSRPIGTLTAIDPKTGDIVGTAELEDNAPEGAAADGKGHIFVNNESKNTIQVIDVKTWEGDGVVADRSVQRTDRHRFGQSVRPHFLRLQQYLRDC